MKNITPLLGSLSAVAIFAATPALANAAIEKNLEVIEVSVSRINATTDELPSTVAVLSQEDIQHIMPNKLSDLFRYEAGVAIESSGGRHGDANINIRGIGGNRVLVIKDGIVMPEGFGSAGVSQGRGSFDPFSLQQVEILKGPASALYGSNALGGVVIINTATPKDLVEKNGGNTHVSANIGYFSEDERPRVGATVATKVGESYLLLQGQAQEFSETDINSDFVPNPKDGEAYNLTAKWQYETDKHSFQLVADYFSQTADNVLNTNLGPISGPPGTEITEATAKDDSSRLHIGVTHKIQDLGVLDKFQWQASYQKSNYEQYEFERTENPGTPTMPFLASHTFTEEWEDFEQEQFSASLLGEKELDQHHFMIGVEGYWTSVVRPVDKLLTDVVADTTTNVISGIAHPGKTFPDADVFKFGIFLQDHFQLNEQLKVVAGLRYDYFENKPDPDEAYNNFNIAQAVPETYSDDAFSPHLGVVFDVSETVSLYGNYSAGFRTPPVAEQYISRSILIPVPGVPHEVVPNNDLQSETSEGLEFGIRWRGEHARFSLAAYRNSYSDFIDSKTIGFRNAPPLFVGPLAIRQIEYQNVDSVRIQGLELNAEIMLDSVLPEGWNGHIDVAGSLIDGENTETGLGLNSVPAHSAVVGVTVSPTPNWQFAGHLQIVDKASDVEPLSSHGQTLPAFEPPSYATLDLSAQWEVADNISINAALYNVFDKKYWPFSAKGDNAAGDLDAKVAPGRNFAVSLNYKF